jgi:hypothetical protein
MSEMRVLVACEFSGTVRDAFAARGHDAWSCDILPSEKPGKHIQGTILDHSIWKRDWDLLIAHPDCTFLTVSGARWMNIPWRQEAQLSALFFVRALWSMPVKRIAIENPVGKLSSLWQAPTQTIQPWQFGDPYAKATCLWLKNLPQLEPTHPKPEVINAQVWLESPGPERKKNRSRTYQGIADAMAEQWSNL